MTPLEKFEKRIQSMEEDYKKGLLPDYLKPYFEWRYGAHGKPTFTLEEAFDMADKATDELDELYNKYPHGYDNLHFIDNDDPWQGTEGFGKDKRLVSYLEIVTDHLADMRLADMWR